MQITKVSQRKVKSPHRKIKPSHTYAFIEVE